MNPGLRVKIALGILVATGALWLAAIFGLIAQDEPPFVLHLSFGAIALTSIDILLTTDVRKKEDDG